MRYYLKLLVAALLIFPSCTYLLDNPQNELVLKEAKGGRFYGGVFKLNEAEYIKTLFPPSIIDVYSYRTASQVYEGLFKFDQKDISHVKKSLIDSYEVNENKTVYTFKLKEGVMFHDNPCFPNGKGRELTADDVAYCFKQICTYSPKNQSFNLFDGILKGARQYYDATANGKVPEGGVEGIKVIDRYTLELSLERPNSIFLFNLARPGTLIYPPEALEKYGDDMRINCVGTGPFTLASIDEEISIILKRNSKYHAIDEHGNQLPFLEAISIQFIKEKKVELMEFRKGNLDMMYRLPTDHIIEILDGVSENQEDGFHQYELQREPEMSTQILAFNNRKGVFKDINVRKAFSFAINKEKILDYVLNGEGYGIGNYGFTPPSFKNYDITQLNGYDFNLDSARYYLKKAGYPNGNGFPEISLDLNAEGERHVNVAVEIQKQLKDHLNIHMELNISPIVQITEKSLSGQFDLIRLAWVADYPSPQVFMWMFYGKNLPVSEAEQSYPNFIRYFNPEFDKYYEKALNSLNEEEALKNFMQAEAVMLKDAPILVLWYDEGYRLLQSYVKNFPSNPMQFRDFAEVYIQPHKNDKVEASLNNQ